MRIAYILLFCLFSFSVFAQSQTPSRSDLEKRRQSILETIKETQEQLEETKNNKNATLAQLRALQSKINERQKLIGNINEEIDAINTNIQHSSTEITDLRKNLEMLKVRYAQSIRYAYKTRSSYDMIAFIFSSNDFNEAIKRLKYLKKYRDYRKEQAEQIRVAQGKIQRKIGELNSVKSQKDELRIAQEQQKQEVQKEALETNKVVKELKGREKELASSIKRNQKALKVQERAIASAIRREIELAKKREEEEQRKREDEQKRLASINSNGMNVATGSGNKSITPRGNNENSKSATSNVANNSINPKPIPVNNSHPSYNLSLTPEVTELSNNFEGNKGKLPWPVVKGFITESFGINKDPVYNIETENSGVEIQTSANAIARAVFSGTVTNIFYVPGMGQCVLVNHGRYFTVYSRLGNVVVKKGQEISIKQTVGNVIANENGDYLMHFELWKVGSNDKSSAQNPENWIAR